MQRTKGKKLTFREPFNISTANITGTYIYRGHHGVILNLQTDLVTIWWSHVCGMDLRTLNLTGMDIKDCPTAMDNWKYLSSTEIPTPLVLQDK